jgi:hypothetical protein
MAFLLSLRGVKRRGNLIKADFCKKLKSILFHSLVDNFIAILKEIFSSAAGFSYTKITFISEKRLFYDIIIAHQGKVIREICHNLLCNKGKP